TIIALLMGSAVISYQNFVDQRNYEETQRRLNAAADAVIGFAIVNKRLPCPATLASGYGVEAAAANNVCTSPFGGYLPGTDIGFYPTDSTGYGVDVWNNKIRYAVAGSVALTGTGCGGTLPGFTNSSNLKANGLSCKP